MSKFSVGQRVKLTAGGREFVCRRLGIDHVDEEVVVVDTDDSGNDEYPLRIKSGDSVSWIRATHVVGVTPRFSVNDKVTIKRTKAVGVIDSISDDAFYQDRPYAVLVKNDEKDTTAMCFFVSDDDLDPYVEPPTPATADDNPRLIALIEERLAKGFASYGHGVQTGDRQYDWPTMTLEEMLDGAIYLAAAIVRLQDADRQHRIDSHYIAVARELATINGWTITNALDALVIAGFASDYYRDPDVYLHVMPRELAKRVDEKRKGAK
jgi:hypothetical protein